jgi:hypothetical protein
MYIPRLVRIKKISSTREYSLTSASSLYSAARYVPYGNVTVGSSSCRFATPEIAGVAKARNRHAKRR